MLICEVLAGRLHGEKETAEYGGAVAACCKSQHVSCSCSAGRWLYGLTQGFVLSANPILAFSSGKKGVIKLQLAWIKEIIKEMETEKGCYCQVLKELIQWHLKNTRKKFGAVRRQVFFTAKLLCYICEKRPGCIAYMWKYLPVVLPFSRGLHPSFFLTKWHSLIPKASGWCASCLKIWQLWWSRRDFGIGPCPTGE